MRRKKWEKEIGKMFKKICRWVHCGECRATATKKKVNEINT